MNVHSPRKTRGCHEIIIHSFQTLEIYHIFVHPFPLFDQHELVLRFYNALLYALVNQSIIMEKGLFVYLSVLETL